MTKRLLFIALLVFCLAVVAVSQGPRPTDGPGGPPRGPQHMGPTCPATMLMVPPMFADRAPTELALTADQQAELKDIITKSEDKQKNLRKTASDASRDLFVLVLTPGADPAKIRSAQEVAARADSEISKAQVEEWIQIGSILKPDQMKQLAEFMRPRRGMGQPGGPPNGMMPPGPGGPGGPPPGGHVGPPPGIEAPPPAP